MSKSVISPREYTLDDTVWISFLDGDELKEEADTRGVQASQERLGLPIEEISFVGYSPGYPHRG